MKLLDLYCGAGGASKGYADAGFEVWGVDKVHQPHYPFNFYLDDALEFPLDGFDVIHASPPCYAHTALRSLHQDIEYEDEIAAIRARLVEAGVPYIIENVVGAPLIKPIQLCGSSFGLRIQRHRLFESSERLFTRGCDHNWQTPIYTKARWHGGQRKLIKSGIVNVSGGGEFLVGYNEADEWRKQMGIDWMNRRELAQAIPPAYTKFVGEQIAAKMQKA